MENSNDIWAFVVALAAVVNGLGVVRLLSGLGEYLKNYSTLKVKHYWVYNLLAHLLLWWSILRPRSAENINFLSYLYLLIGPTLLYLCAIRNRPRLFRSGMDVSFFCKFHCQSKSSKVTF